MVASLISTFATPRGRLSRSDWCLRLVQSGVTALAFGMLALAAAGNDGAALVALLYLWCVACLSARRLHDTGRAGRTQLLFLVPVVGAIWLAVLLLQAGARGRNRYGDDPGTRLDYLRVDIHH